MAGKNQNQAKHYEDYKQCMQQQNRIRSHVICG